MHHSCLVQPAATSKGLDGECEQVEPDRWYYHADRLGLLVWQDMPSMCGAKEDTWYQDCWTANRTITAVRHPLIMLNRLPPSVHPILTQHVCL